MSTVKRIVDSRWKRATTSSASSSVVPRSRRRWIASARMTTPPETLSESITVTRSSPRACAASRALSAVPESFPEMRTQRIRSKPSSSAKAASKSAGVGWELCGCASEARSFS